VGSGPLTSSVDEGWDAGDASHPLSLVVMGPTGVGKTAVGQAVADRLRAEFLDADDYHDPADIVAMRHGIPMDDSRRRPWLERVQHELVARQLGRVVLACSALRAAHRRILDEGLPTVRFVALVAPRDVLADRIEHRTDHFAGVELLDDQLQTLELTPEVQIVDATEPLEAVVAAVVAKA
jgi:carbohydrate kinase (thermoresistant glucokinase family)